LAPITTRNKASVYFFKMATVQSVLYHAFKDYISNYDDEEDEENFEDQVNQVRKLVDDDTNELIIFFESFYKNHTTIKFNRETMALEKRQMTDDELLEYRKNEISWLVYNP
jgi:hypothetical protein